MTERAYSIRPFETIEDFRACVDLQEETWGRGFSERVPTAILKVSQLLGGVAAGAYAQDGRLMGFVFGMTGLRQGETVHWSDMLAVRPEARAGGLGLRLKAFQREAVLSLGIEKVFWTFDPLRSLNAHLNFGKLGVVARKYVEDMYGVTDSPLHRGIGTDRLVALWLLNSGRVRARLEGRKADPERGEAEEAPAALASVGGGAWPRPASPNLSLEADRVSVAIPADIGAIMEADMGLAISWREATRAALCHYLDLGYMVVGFERGSRTSRYVLTRPDDSGYGEA